MSNQTHVTFGSEGPEKLPSNLTAQVPAPQRPALQEPSENDAYIPEIVNIVVYTNNKKIYIVSGGSEFDLYAGDIISFSQICDFTDIYKNEPFRVVFHFCTDGDLENAFADLGNRVVTASQTCGSLNP